MRWTRSRSDFKGWQRTTRSLSLLDTGDTRRLYRSILPPPTNHALLPPSLPSLPPSPPPPLISTRSPASPGPHSPFSLHAPSSHTMDSARRALARASRSPSPSDDPSPFASAPSVAAHKIARFSGAPLAGKKKSKFELAREQEAEKAKREAEDAAEAYKAFVDEFGGEEETGPSNGPRTRIIGGGGGGGRMPHKGFVKAGGGEKYNPLAERPPPPPAPYAAQSFAPAIPTGPRGAGGSPGGFKPMAPRQPTRPVASSLMGDDDEVRFCLSSFLPAYR